MPSRFIALVFIAEGLLKAWLQVDLGRRTSNGH